jgi:hypothetical protein
VLCDSGRASGLKVAPRITFENLLKKVSKRFGSLKNPPYLCTRNLNETTRRE